LAPIDPNPPAICEADESYGVALKVSNGLSTLCYRVTTTYFYSLATAPREEEVEPDVGIEGELADTGFDFGWLTLLAISLTGTGLVSMVAARRRAN